MVCSLSVSMTTAGQEILEVFIGVESNKPKAIEVLDQATRTLDRVTVVADDAVTDAVAILAVVEKAHAVMALGEVHPLLAADDNWDIDMFYTEKSWPVDDLVSMKWTEDGPAPSAVCCTG